MTVPPAPGEGRPARDPGLQPERTSLAWRRTVLSLLVLDLLVFRAWLLAIEGRGAHGPGIVAVLGVCAAAAVLATAALATCARVRARELRHGTTGPPAVVMRVATASFALLGLATIAVVVLGR
ncbi:DUF202 domain-containing protein [Sinomonas sp. P10A9]|uniref:DUF202 domain-containing protein n=1 Tax=Sinomonas puerhi TaxID=3238584 RepID=A0AB39L0M4_9MICC